MCRPRLVIVKSRALYAMVTNRRYAATASLGQLLQAMNLGWYLFSDYMQLQTSCLFSKYYMRLQTDSSGISLVTITSGYSQNVYLAPTKQY
jgi:lantibiotic modifying enzyme